jgi:hypothetical protein
MAFTITDEEFTESKNDQERVYKDVLLRGPATTYMDPLGHARWDTDYFTLRATGLSHPAALKEVRRRIYAEAGVPNPEVPPQPPNPQPGQGALVGRLRLENGMFVDDTGPVLPIFAHVGDLFSKFVRDPGFAFGQMDELVRAGYHGARVWMQLGCGNEHVCPAIDDHGRVPYWLGREVGPSPEITSDYWGKVSEFLLAFKNRGLRIAWSQGDPAQTGHSIAARKDYARKAAQVATSVDAHIVAFFDAGNEAWQNDADRFYDIGNPNAVANMTEFVNAYKDTGGSALCTLTDTPGEAVQGPYGADALCIPQTDLWDVHSWRGSHSWDKRRHIFSLPYEGKPRLRNGINSESPGNGDLVSASENKGELDHEAVALLGAMAAISRQAFVWFSGEGVKLNAGLQGEQGFESTPRLIRLLPKDVMRYERLHHSGDTWNGTRVFSIPSTSTNNEIRCDGAVSSDGHFAYVVDGPIGSHTLRVERPFTGSIITPHTGVVDPFNGSAGEVKAVEFTRGRVITGKLS